MSELSADELAIVAREVTGNPEWHVMRSGMVGLGPMRRDWNPAFKPVKGNRFDPAGMNYRGQALEVVEWLTDRIHKNIDGQDNYFRQLLAAIHWRDTTALQRMVLELRNPK